MTGRALAVHQRHVQKTQHIRIIIKLRIFGSQASAKKPGSRSYKLDDNSFQGVFLGTTAKDTNCYIHDTKTKRVKISI